MNSSSPSVVPGWLRLARAYMRLSSPVGFVARRFIRNFGSMPSAVPGSKGGLCIDVGAGTSPYRGVIEKYLCVQHYIAYDIAASDTTDVVGDATRMPFIDGCAQWVTSFDVMQHIADSEAVLAEVSRVLAPGGLFVLTFPFNYCECDVLDFKRWTLAGMERDLRNKGFDIAQIEQRGGRFFALACALNWTVQHMIPGQRQGWRARRSMSGIARAALMLLLTTPTTALQWLMLGLDSLFPNKGCYMGGIAVAVKPLSK